MTQTKLASATEAACNVAVGYAVATVTQSVVSLVRSYALRRLFNWMGENND